QLGHRIGQDGVRVPAACVSERAVSGTLDTVRASPQSAAASLDALLSIFESTAMEGTHVAAVLPTLAELTEAGASVVGVKDLLRAWHVLVQRRAISLAHLPAQDVIAMADWFMRLQRYLDGTLPAEERTLLAQLPREIAWLPQMPPELSNEIARRLSLAPP